MEFDTQKQSVIQVRTGIFVGKCNKMLQENLQKEISDKFGWDFEAVVQNQKNVWNGILNRLDIGTNDRMEKVRFYTNVYRALCRNLWSDVMENGCHLMRRYVNLRITDHVALGL